MVPFRVVDTLGASAQAASWNTSARLYRVAGADRRHAVADGGGGPSALGRHGPVPGGEDQAVTVRDEGRGPARLGPGALLQEQELAPGVVDPRVVQVDHDLQRKHEVAVQVAVERVPVLLPVLEQDRGGLGLPGRMAHRQPCIQGVGPWGGTAELVPPVTGDREQVRVQRLLQLLDRFGVGAGEVAVLAFPEAVPAHVDRGAEVLVLLVEAGDPRGLLRGEQPRQQRPPVLIELLGDTVPVAAVDAVSPVVDGGGHAASRRRRVCLAAGPPTYPPADPSERTTRWQGTTTGSGLVLHAVAAARTALGFPAAAATAA